MGLTEVRGFCSRSNKEAVLQAGEMQRREKWKIWDNGGNNYKDLKSWRKSQRVGPAARWGTGLKSEEQVVCFLHKPGETEEEGDPGRSRRGCPQDRTLGPCIWEADVSWQDVACL